MTKMVYNYWCGPSRPKCMINLVKKPQLRALSGATPMKNDPGSSSGGGNAYEKLTPNNKEAPPSTKEEQAENPRPKLSLVPQEESEVIAENQKAIQSRQIGLSEIIAERLTQPHGRKTDAASPSGQSNYSADEHASNAKGMLVNVKAE